MRRRRQARIGVLLLTAQLACSHDRATDPAAPVVSVSVPVAASSLVHRSRDQSADAVPSSGLTELAARMQNLVVAALDGRALPKTPFPLDPHSPTRILRRPVKATVEGGKPKISEVQIPASAQLEFFGFSIAIQIVPPRAPRANDSLPPEFAPAYEAVLFLSDAGLKVAQLRAGKVAMAVPETGFMAAIASVGRQVHGSLCQHRIASWLADDAERPALGNEVLFARLMERRPTPEQLDEVRSSARCEGPPPGFSADDIWLVARSSSGEIYSFEIKLRATERGLLIDARNYVIKAWKPE